MARVEDSPRAIPVAQIASRAGQSKPIDADFPAPSGIGDSIVGIKEGEPVHVSGQFDSIVDGLIFTGRLVAPFVSECTRCLKPIDEDWPVDVTVFFPYESGQDKANGKGGKNKKDDEIDIIAGNIATYEGAKDLMAAGADAVSVLTERDYFKGSIEYLRDIAKSIGLPVLRKDFIVEPYQIYEAKAAGASPVLLICALLPQEELTELVDLTRSLDMDALVEAHNKEEISQALWAGSDIIGVNNRNLKDFTVSLDTSVNLRRAVPKEIIFVAESGICSAEDISLLRKNRVDAVLIGESLMRSDNKKRTLAALKGVGGED